MEFDYSTALNVLGAITFPDWMFQTDPSVEIQGPPGGKGGDALGGGGDVLLVGTSSSSSVTL